MTLEHGRFWTPLSIAIAVAFAASPGCKRVAGKAATPNATPSAPASPATAPAPSASAGSAEPITPPAPDPDAALTFIDELPPLPEAEREKLFLLRQACPLGLRTKGKEAPQVGCRECYAYKARKPAGGRIALDPESFYGVDAVMRGSFSAAGVEEAAISLWGCEPHSEHWGGLLVVRTEGGSARVIDYFTGVHPDRCDTYRKKDGRDLLVCSFGGYHAGTLYAFLASFDVARSAAADGDAHWDYLVDTVDETEDACLRAGEPDPVPVTRSELGSHAFRDLDRDGVRDLAVEVTHYTERSAAATAAHCRAAKNAEKSAKPAPRLPMRRVRKDVVEFLFDGERFVPRKK